MLYKFSLETGFNSVTNITDMVRKAVEESGVEDGICVVYNPHTTASIVVTSFWDPAGFEDLQDEICRLIPTKVDFKHQHDTPEDAAGHVKSSLYGVSIALVIHEGKLLLGHSQGLYFMEFDGPRNREVIVKTIAD